MIREGLSDTKELPERARYYQGVIDVDLLKSGQQYKELKDSYIIFICVDDIFGRGLPKYTFENTSRENSEIKLGDRTYKYFFIARNCDILLNERQKAFLKLVTENTVSDAFTKRISHLTKEAKLNLQWKRQYMEWARQRTYDYNDGKEAGRKEGLIAGLAEGKHENAVSAAINLLKMNLGTPEQIAQAQGLTLEEVLELQKSISEPVVC